MLVKDRLRQVERSRELDAWITEENYRTRVEEAAKAGNPEQTDKALSDTQTAFKTLASKRVTAASLLQRVFRPERYGEALKAATKAIAIPLPGQLFDNRAQEATDLFQSAFKCLHAADFVELYQQTDTITAVIPDSTGEVHLRRLLREINTRFTRVVTPEVDVLRRALQRARREVRTAAAGPSGGQTAVEVVRKEYERALAAKTLQLRNEERTEQYNALYTSFVRFLLHADYADLDRLRTVIKAQLVEIAPVGFTVPSQPKTLFQPGADEQRYRRRVDFLEWLNLEAAMALVALAQKHVAPEALQRLGYPTMTSYQPQVSLHRYYFQVPSPPRDAPQSRNKEPLKNLHFGADGEIWFEGTSFRAVTGLQRVPGKQGKKGSATAKSFLDGETRDIARGDKIFEVADVLFDPALTPAEMKQLFNKKVDDLGRIEASLGGKKQPSIFRMTVLRPIADVARPLAQRKIVVEKATLLELLATEAFVMQRDARNRSGLVFTGTGELLFGMKKTVLGMEPDLENALQPGDRIQSIGGVVTAFDVYKGPERDALVRLTADVRGQSEAYLTLVVERDGTPSMPLQDPVTQGLRALARRLEQDDTIASAGAVRDLLVQVGGLREDRATQIFGAPETAQSQSWLEWLRQGTPAADAAQVRGPTFLTSLRNATNGDAQYNGIISTIEKFLGSKTDSLSQGLPGWSGVVRSLRQYVFFFTPRPLQDNTDRDVIDRMLKGSLLDRNVYGYLATVEYRRQEQGCNRFSEDDASLCYELKAVQVVGPPHGLPGGPVSFYASKTQLVSAYQRTDVYLRQLRSTWQGSAYRKPGPFITSRFVATMADDANKAAAADPASTRAEALLVQSLLQAR